MAKKISSLYEDAQRSEGFGFKEGRVRITKTVSTIDQIQGSGQGAGEKFCAVRCFITNLGEDGTPIEGEFDHFDLKVGKASEFHPGQASGPDDEEPEDLGEELEVEGNTIVSVTGKAPNEKSKYIMFTHAMQENGFKADVLRNTYLPDWNGMEVDIETEVLADDFYGASNRPKEGRKHSRLIVSKDGIRVFPYDKKAKKSTAGKAEAKPAATNGKAKETPKAKDEPASKGSNNLLDKALAVVASNNAGEDVAFSDFTKMMQKVLLKDFDVDPVTLKKLRAEYGDPDKVEDLLKGVGATWNEDDAIATFPDEE